MAASSVDLTEFARAFFSSWAVWGEGVLAGVKTAIRYVATHTGLPTLLVAAVFVCIGYRILKRTVRVAIEVALALLVLSIVAELGWIRW